MMVSLGITSAVEALKRSTALAFRIGPLPPLEESLLWLASFLSAVVMFMTLYAIIRAPKIRLRDRVAAAGVGALLWEIAKFGFAVYVTRAATRSPVYASLGAPFLILLWAYWSAAIFLLGAELARILSSHARGELAAASN
jgi:membrane protein